MRLLEFQNPQVLVRDLAARLGKVFELERIGGNGRVYTVGGALGAVYVVNGGPKAIGIAYDPQSKAVTTVFVWNQYHPEHSPDMAVDVPADATIDNIIEPLVHFVQSPRTGLVEDASNPLPEPEQGENADADALRAAETPQQVADQLKTMADAGRLTLLGRNADGTHFELPEPVQKVMSRLEGMVSQHFGPNNEGMSMEEQYANLKEQVKLVASGQSAFIKSILITGAPSSGKTYSVMKTLEEMGLKESVHFTKKKGHVSTKSLYRLLVEQVDGMLVFDDCDSVVDEGDKAENMLKGALDTDPIREVDYDVARAINTAVMPRDERIKFVDSVSRILRGKGTAADVEMHRHFLKKKPVGKGAAATVKPQEDDSMERMYPSRKMEPRPNEDELFELEQFFGNTLPNKIDFRGRIIFISNHKTEWWAEPIRTRAFIIEMAFSDEEMMKFIRTIKKYIHANISEDQKDEVLDEIERLWKAGKLSSPINFRLVQAGFDLRLIGNWKNIIAGF